MKALIKDWIVLDGKLKKINYKGRSDFRFTDELAELVVNKFSSKGAWVLDPFAGFGTTIKAANKLGRKAIGFEIDKERARFASKGIRSPNKIINDSVKNIKNYKLPKFDLLFTSPPYITVRLQDDPQGKTYFRDLIAIFKDVIKVLKPKGKIIIEVSNIRDTHGIRPLAWQIGELLSKLFIFEDEIIVCNSNKKSAILGFDHSYLLIFTNKS